MSYGGSPTEFIAYLLTSIIYEWHLIHCLSKSYFLSQ